MSSAASRKRSRASSRRWGWLQWLQRGPRHNRTRKARGHHGAHCLARQPTRDRLAAEGLPCLAGTVLAFSLFDALLKVTSGEALVVFLLATQAASPRLPFLLRRHIWPLFACNTPVHAQLACPALVPNVSFPEHGLSSLYDAFSPCQAPVVVPSHMRFSVTQARRPNQSTGFSSIFSQAQ